MAAPISLLHPAFSLSALDIRRAFSMRSPKLEVTSSLLPVYWLNSHCYLLIPSSTPLAAYSCSASISAPIAESLAFA